MPTSDEERNAELLRQAKEKRLKNTELEQKLAEAKAEFDRQQAQRKDRDKPFAESRRQKKKS